MVTLTDSCSKRSSKIPNKFEKEVRFTAYPIQSVSNWPKVSHFLSKVSSKEEPMTRNACAPSPPLKAPLWHCWNCWNNEKLSGCRYLCACRLITTLKPSWGEFCEGIKLENQRSLEWSISGDFWKWGSLRFSTESLDLLSLNKTTV